MSRTLKFGGDVTKKSKRRYSSKTSHCLISTPSVSESIIYIDFHLHRSSTMEGPSTPAGVVERASRMAASLPNLFVGF